MADLVAQLREPLPLDYAPPGTKLPWADHVDLERRRCLAVAVAARLSEGMWFLLGRFGLLTDDDVDWLLDELPSLPSAAHATLAACVGPMLGPPTPENRDRARSIGTSHPAYQAVASWHASVFGGPEAGEHLNALRTRMQEVLVERPAAFRAQMVADLLSALEAAAADIGTWWRVALQLAGRGNREGVFTHDLTARPGWALLSVDQRQLVLRLGERYLEEHSPQPSSWAGTVTDGVTLADWCGVYLLTTLARHSPGRVRAMAPDFWRTWAHAIVGAWNFEAGKDDRLRCDLVDLAPADGRAHIVGAALDHFDALSRHDQPLIERPLFAHLCPELAPATAERLVAGRYNERLSESVLRLLAVHAPDVALTACQRLAADPESPISTIARRMLANLDPAGAVDYLRTSSPTGDDIAAIVRHIDIRELDNNHLAALSRLLLDAFPVADDPPREHFAFASDASEVRYVRNRTVQRLGELGEVRALERLAEGRAAIDRYLIRYYLRGARAMAADLNYVPLEPVSLLALLARADARLVCNDLDLLNVIAEQLRDIQRELTHGNSIRQIWDMIAGQDPRPNSEDDISDWIQHQLRLRLNNGTVIDREIQVARRRGRGVGTRIDLTATRTTATQPTGTARVIVEAKLINNDDLDTALHVQLVQKYMIPENLRFGIYLVYWVDPDQRPSNWAGAPRDRATLEAKLKRQATSIDGNLEVQVVLLDISRPRS